MSDRCYLDIGRMSFVWRDHVPTFLTFVFEAEDLFFQFDGDNRVYSGSEALELEADEDDYGPLRPAGYRTTASKARSVLDRNGYTIDFFAEIYDIFREDLSEQYRDLLTDEYGQTPEVDGDEAQASWLADRQIAQYEDSPLADLLGFVTFMRRLMEDLEAEGIEESRLVSEGRGILFEDLQWKLFDRATRFPVDAVRAAGLFSEQPMEFYPEVVSLIYTRLLLDAVPDDAPVELEVSNVVYTVDGLRSIHLDLAFELLQKVDVYQRVFSALSDRREDVQDRFQRIKVRNALNDLGRATTAQEKGDRLEAMMDSIFSLKPDLDVVESKFNMGDEEIDLIVKNNVDRPFWQNLGSPVFFVECKNWKAPVGSPEVRDFETKLQDHHGRTRFGILVAPGGFTEEARTAVKRASREPHNIVLIDRENLDQLAEEQETILDWLEALLCRPI